ncbi:MAG TPA: class I tRNA ligase family protein, partial [Roseiflexaceae bacterium]|nr:class I tRNA ligase family protein [Roseiflexaceae bacterium]
PEALIERYGADPVRYWACGGALGADRPINEEEMRQGGRLITKLWNAARLIAGIENEELKIENGSPTASQLSILNSQLLPADRALLSWLQRLIIRATESFQGYDYAAAGQATERFFWGTLCDNYLEWVKGRLYDGSSEERHAAQATLHQALLATLKLFAPILPHITEEIFQRLYGGTANADTKSSGFNSIHSSAWPRADHALIDEPAERAGAALLAITGAARRFKSSRKLGLGAELAHIAIAAGDKALRADLERSQADIRSVTRAREIAFAEAPDERFEELEPGLWMRIEA